MFSYNKNQFFYFFRETKPYFISINHYYFLVYHIWFPKLVKFTSECRYNQQSCSKCCGVASSAHLSATLLCNLSNPIVGRNTHEIKMLSFAITIPVVPVITLNKWKQRHRQRLRQRVSASIHHDSLRVLEWDKLCDVVASFATTSLGRQALKVPFQPFLLC